MRSPAWKRRVQTGLLFGGALASSAVVIEVGTRAIVELRALPVDLPAYSFSTVRASFWRDLDPAFGVWHQPHGRYRHRTACFDVTYTSNSYGARDAERTRGSLQPRVVVVGDSFVEGRGVDSANRLTEVLEYKTGIEHLNFGTSGHFGPTQYLVLYRTLAKGFAHRLVVVGILPDNDFEDDDFEFGRTAHGDRYRPYLVGSYPDYHLTYYRATLREPSGAQLLRSAKRFLGDFTYTYNLFVYLRSLRSYESAARARGRSPDQGTAAPAFSRFYDFSEPQWQRLRYVVEQFSLETAGKALVVVTIPRLNDLARFSHAGPSPLSRKLSELAHELGFEYVDLLPAFYGEGGDPRRLYITCDGHWSKDGHQLAASFLRRARAYEVLEAARSSRESPPRGVLEPEERYGAPQASSR